MAGTCPLSKFRVPGTWAEDLPGHKGGPHLLAVANENPHRAGLLFLSYHMASDLDGKITTVAKGLGIAMPERGRLCDELHAAYRKVKQDHPNQHLLFIGYCLFLTVALPASFVWWMFQPTILKSIIVATFFELYFLNIFHTRNHRNTRLYESKFLSDVLTPVYDFIEDTFGDNTTIWRTNHNVKHHVHTNDYDVDTDIPGVYPLVRNCYDTELQAHHKFQTFYWPLLAFFIAIKFPLNNYFAHKTSGVYFMFWLAMVIVLPACLHGWHGFALSMFLQGWAGFQIGYKFAVSHCHSSLRATHNAEEDYTDVDKWLAAQIQDSMSWGGYLTTFIYGGINLQIEHHICPSMDPPLYALVAPEVKRICEEHGIKYTHEASYLHAMLSFHKDLWHMGTAPNLAEPLPTACPANEEPVKQ